MPGYACKTRNKEQNWVKNESISIIDFEAVFCFAIALDPGVDLDHSYFSSRMQHRTQQSRHYKEAHNSCRE